MDARHHMPLGQAGPCRVAFRIQLDRTPEVIDAARDVRWRSFSGVSCVGMGDRFDEHARRDMPAGSYIVMPKGMHHFAIAKGDVVQAHGVGPFKIHWVK